MLGQRKFMGLSHGNILYTLLQNYLNHGLLKDVRLHIVKRWYTTARSAEAGPTVIVCSKTNDYLKFTFTLLSASKKPIHQ